MSKKIFFRWAGITIGSLFVALALDIFLVPNRIAAGGVTGLATIFFYVLRIPIGYTILLLNFILLFLTFRELGLTLVIRSLYGAAVTAGLVELLKNGLPVPTHDLLLASIYGGILTGLGIGIVLRSGGTTGGTDLVARLVHKYLPVTMGQALLGADSLVITLAGIFFNAELALYALLGLLATGKVIDLVQEGLSYAKAAFIVSKRSQEVADAISRELGRGATGLAGQGMYTGEKRPVLISVVAKTEESRLKDLVYEVDADAFVFITEAHDVIGEFTRNPRLIKNQ